MLRNARKLLALLAIAMPGCASTLSTAAMENPTTIANSNYEEVWAVAIEVLDKYFDIAYENRYDGRIETKPVSGATCFEPWRPDSIGCRARLESTLQTIRRRGFVLVTPAPAGGFQIVVEVYKEIEDLPNPIGMQFGGGTFISSIEPIREEVVSAPVAPGAGWISLGRDTVLESRILAEIQQLADLPVSEEENQIVLR